MYSLHFAAQTQEPGRKRPAALCLPPPDLEEADCASPPAREVSAKSVITGRACRDATMQASNCRGKEVLVWGRFRKRNLKHAKECSIQQRRGFACGVCRWKRRFGCSRNSAVSAARFESGFRERDGQGQHWRGPHSHGGFLKMIVCEAVAMPMA